MTEGRRRQEKENLARNSSFCGRTGELTIRAGTRLWLSLPGPGCSACPLSVHLFGMGIELLIKASIIVVIWFVLVQQLFDSYFYKV